MTVNGLEYCNKSFFPDQLVLFLSTYKTTNQPMIINTRGKFNIFPGSGYPSTESRKPR